MHTTVFRSASLPQTERLARFDDFPLHSDHPMRVTEAAPEPFQATARALDLGPVNIVELTCSPSLVRRTPAMIRQADPELCSVVFPRRGQLVVTQDGREALLDTYEEERRPIAADMLGISTGVHRGEVRRGEATRQLGLGYRESSLTEETREAPGAVRAGDRAPDGVLDGVRLFDAFRGPHWTVVAVGVEAPALPVSVVRGKTLEAYGTGLLLVRPDG